jgi:hypothetical protein
MTLLAVWLLAALFIGAVAVAARRLGVEVRELRLDHARVNRLGVRVTRLEGRP